MIDIHCHILPGVDDGPAEQETALAMIRLAAEHGTTDLVASPHANPRYAYSAELTQEALQRLQEAAGPTPRLHRGCDFRLTYENLAATLADPQRFTINGGRYMLVEFSEEVLSKGTAEIFAELRRAGVVPIITRPERNRLIRDHRRRLAAWVHRGGLIQVTGQSLLGRFGERSQEAAIAMMDARLVHVIASDGHDLQERPPVLDESRALVAERWGEETARRLFVENPQAILEDRPIEAPRPRLRRDRAKDDKKWWQIWK